MFAFFNVPLLVGPNELTLQSGAQLGTNAIGGATITRIGSETTAPTLTVGLANDTGLNNRDRITSVATLSGTATDVSGIRKLQLSRANGLWIDVTSQLTSGTYEITSTELATILGGPIVDGRYDLRIQAIDALANESPITEFSFVLDTAGPGVPTVRTISVEWATDQLSSLQQLLDARSDSWPMGFDIWLVDDFGQVVGIPRTSNITGVMVQHDEKVLED
jgi:hypothetical protein